MDQVSGIKKRRKGRWRITGLIIIIFLIIGCMIGLIIKRKPLQAAINKLGRQRIALIFMRDREKTGEEMRMGATGEPMSAIELENQYKEFEELFREQQNDIKKLTEELLKLNMLEEKEYLILFDEEWYLDRQIGNPLGNYTEFLYNNNAFESVENEEFAGILNENIALKEALNSIIKTGIVIDVGKYWTGDMWILEFEVNTEFTPFITGNNGVINSFVYCEDEGCEIYGCRKIEDNWYLWISPGPDG